MKNQSKGKDFFLDVLEVVKLIPRGRITTYGAIATYLGANRSARMVGYALNQTIVEMNIPAHRVVNRLGMLSGKHHFPESYPMETRLAEEGIDVVEDRIQNFERLFWDPSIELEL